MRTYSQNKEDLFVLDYFGNHKGRLLSIGENNGTDLSNARLLIEHGWEAVLFEPGSIVMDLYTLHKGNKNVQIFPFGIGDKEETVIFWESGCHIPNGKDKGLVSTANFEETKRWPDVEFTERTIDLIPYSMVAEHGPFDFISIDAEGFDWLILQQIDLSLTSCLCIEWNSDNDLFKLFTQYCNEFKLFLAKHNNENLIFIR